MASLHVAAANEAVVERAPYNLGNVIVIEGGGGVVLGCSYMVVVVH